MADTQQFEGGFILMEELLKEFDELPIKSLYWNPFTRVGNGWMLITAGDQKANNTMTAQWGLFGVLWRKYMFQIYIRPQRFTKKFVDQNALITISFLEEKYRDALKICGTRSGREGNKWEMSGLHPYYIDGTTAVEEARLVIIGRKQYSQWINPDLFTEKENDTKCYPEKDYHEAYTFEVSKVLHRGFDNGYIDF